jgi:hypothetical protein
MATTGGLNTTRNNLFYLGAGKESAWGTAVAPTWFWHWLDGSDANPDAKFQEEREGDTSPHISLVYKTAQVWGIKVVEYVRPITIGYALQALLGSGSDSFAGGTTTTLAASITAGATTFSSTADLGITGTGYMGFSTAYGDAAYEVAKVDYTTKTGVGPYVYTLASSGTFKSAHASAAAIGKPQVHTLTRQVGPFDAYSIEAAFGSASYGLFKVFRVQDCVCTDLMLESSAPGHPVKASHTWYGAPGIIQASLASIVQEGNGVVGAAGGPLTHHSAQSTWSLDGVSTGNAATIKSFKLTLKNGTQPEELLSEGLYAPFYMPGNFDITADLTAIFNGYNQYLETYYGTTAATTNATDSILTGYGSASVTWANANIAGSLDGLNALACSLPNVAYKAAKLTPRLDGKPLEQQISLRAVRSPAQATPLTLTLTNNWPSAY